MIDVTNYVIGNREIDIWKIRWKRSLTNFKLITIIQIALRFHIVSPTRTGKVYALRLKVPSKLHGLNRLVILAFTGFFHECGSTQFFIIFSIPGQYIRMAVPSIFPHLSLFLVACINFIIEICFIISQWSGFGFGS